MKSAIRFSPQLRVWFYIIFGVLFLSGVVWLLINYANQGSLDGPLNSWGPTLLKIHGAAGMASLLILGVLIPVHMLKGWSQGRNRITAIVMIVCVVLMILSGWGLYYCGDDQLRQKISWLHNFIGCVFPVILLWHITVGRIRKNS